MTECIRLSILSASRLLGDAIALRLMSEEEIEVVATAGTIEQLRAAAQTTSTDVLLVVLPADSEDAVESTWEAKSAVPAAGLIVLGSGHGPATIAGCVEAGAAAYLESDSPVTELLHIIHGTHEGSANCSLEVLAAVAGRIRELSGTVAHTPDCEPSSLSPREAEVAELVATGFRNKQISRRLEIKLPTVKSHVRNILKKLQLDQRDMLKQAWRLGVLTPG